MTQGLHLAAVGLYAFGAALLGISFARDQRRLPSIALGVVGVAIAVHAGSLIAYQGEFGEMPLVGLGPSLSLLSLLVAIGSAGVATVGRTGPLGLILVPVAAALAAVAQVVGLRPDGELHDFRGPWFVLHVVLALVGYAALAVAWAAAVMYLLQWRQLKGKRFGAVFRFFPPLDTLDRIGRLALIAGLPVLTVALLLGWAWTERFGQPMSPTNPKVVWGVLTWLVIAASLGVRVGGGRTARRAALATVVGFALVVVSYLLLRAGIAHPGGGFL